MTDEFKRYQAMRNIIRGKFNQQDVEALSGKSQEEILSKEGLQGKVYEGFYNGEQKKYFSNHGIWLSGREIRVEKAYRVVREDEKTMTVREVTGSEIEAVVEICRQVMVRLLSNRRKANQE